MENDILPSFMNSPILIEFFNKHVKDKKLGISGDFFSKVESGARIPRVFVCTKKRSFDYKNRLS